MPGPAAKVTGAARSAPVNPAGRVDVLLLRLGELVTRNLERRLASLVGVPDLNLWDGPEGGQTVVQGFCDEHGLTGFSITPATVAQRAGLIRKKRRAGR